MDIQTRQNDTIQNKYSSFIFLRLLLRHSLNKTNHLPEKQHNFILTIQLTVTVLKRILIAIITKLPLLVSTKLAVVSSVWILSVDDTSRKVDDATQALWCSYVMLCYDAVKVLTLCLWHRLRRSCMLSWVSSHQTLISLKVSDWPIFIDWINTSFSLVSA